METIVGHVAPDWDCLTSLWLLKRYGPFADAHIALVNTGQPDPEVLKSAAAVVDTGREYDPSLWRFDHHQMPGAASNDTCAAALVAEAVLGSSFRDQQHYLDPLLYLVWGGDTGRADARDSRLVGLHAQLSARRAAKWSDEALVGWAFQELDLLAAHLKQRHEMRQHISSHLVYTSADGLVVALDNAPMAASYAAIEAGARLVIFHADYPDIPTVAVGVQRGGEWLEPHVGDLVQAIVEWRSDGIPDGTVVNELATWYKHSAGFFAGRGTPKAPDARPFTTSIVLIARAIDACWKR